MFCILANLDFVLNIFLANTFQPPTHAGASRPTFQSKICLRHKICVIRRIDLLSAVAMCLCDTGRLCNRRPRKLR